MNPSLIAPVPEEERLLSLDALRGLAVLGILLMNIIGFGLYASAYSNPAVAGGSEGVNLWVYVFNFVMVDGKMRGIFSLLFGASMLLLTDRWEAKGLGMYGAELYYRRLLWLAVFGILHGFFLWFGEILYAYAILGLLIFPFRRMSPRGLSIFACVMFVVLTGFSAFFAVENRNLRDDAMKFSAMKKQGATLTDKQEEKVKKWEEKWRDYYPDKKKLEEDRKAFATNFFTAVPRRAQLVLPWHRLSMYDPKQWDIVGMMLLGIALLKSGFLTGAWSTGRYLAVAAGGLLIGLPPAIWGAWNFHRWKFDQVALSFSFVPYEISRVAICLAYVALFLVLLRSGALAWLFARLAATGRMAFTNYIMQSVLCTLFFTGFHMYGRLERHQIYYVAAAIWVLELIWSPIWLRHFRMGPFEWAWRCLTYWKRQPLRIPDAEPEPTPGAGPEPAAA